MTKPALRIRRYGSARQWAWVLVYGYRYLVLALVRETSVAEALKLGGMFAHQIVD